MTLKLEEEKMILKFACWLLELTQLIDVKVKHEKVVYKDN